MTENQRLRVVIVQKHVPRYRVTFYDQVRARLAEVGISLDLIYGQPIGEDASKDDMAEVPWGTFVRNREFAMGRRRILCYQPVFRQTAQYDLVVVEQASRLVVNYLLLARQMIGGAKVAMWGHGENLQADDAVLARLAEMAKRCYTRLPHWFFAYTAGCAARVSRLGYPASRITVVQNSVDVQEMTRYRREISDDDVAQVHHMLGTDPATQCVYVGALYAEKRLDFLLTAGEALARRFPTFSLVVVGAGPEREMIERAMRTHSWLRYVGPKFGREMAQYVCASQLMLLPGLVGLAVLDSFALGVPLVTMANSRHSPEFEYLISGNNSVVISGPASDFVDTVVRVLEDSDGIAEMKRNCIESADKYSIEEMVRRFAGGVEAALKGSAQHVCDGDVSGS